MIATTKRTLLLVCTFLLSSSLFSQDVPDGFKMVKTNIGKGAYSQVHLLKSKLTGEYFVIKYPHSINNKKNVSNFYKHVNLHVGWTILGLTDVPMYYSVKKSRGKVKSFYILQGYVDGPTLQNAYLKEGFKLKKGDPMTTSLLDFVDTLLRNRVFIDDVNAKNIMYDKKRKRWQLIDSQRIKIYDQRYPTYEDAFDKLRRKMTKKWTEGNNYVGRKEVDAFFDYYEKKMLPKVLKERPKRDPKIDKYLKEFAKTQHFVDGYDYYTEVIPKAERSYNWDKVKSKLGSNCKTLFKL